MGKRAVALPGAALTGANLGVSALAVSIDWGESIRWETAADIAALALDWLVDAPARTVVNLNVPNVPRSPLSLPVARSNPT